MYVVNYLLLRYERKIMQLDIPFSFNLNLCQSYLCNTGMICYFELKFMYLFCLDASIVSSNCCFSQLQFNCNKYCFMKLILPLWYLMNKSLHTKT